jgi:hypothetical protein
MIPGATSFKEFYADHHQIAVLDTIANQSVDIQVNWMLAVMHRHGGA